jgi:uncharacterized oxidoreductase
VPPGVQADLMPLADVIGETIAPLRRQPTPPDICVERVGFLHGVEWCGQFEQMFATLNGPD